MFFSKTKNLNLLIFFLLFLSIPLIVISLTNNNDNCLDISLDQKEKRKNENNIEIHNYFRELTALLCTSTSYSKADIQEECNRGPSSFDRILKYSSYSNYISSHNYHSNGLNYVTSLLVDSDSHHFGNFMNDGAGMIILYIIDGLLLLGWVPFLCCWKKRCCLFDDCLYENDCCIIFWHILTYFLAAAILSFLIVVLCFGE